MFIPYWNFSIARLLKRYTNLKYRDFPVSIHIGKEAKTI